MYHKYGTEIFLVQNDHHVVIFGARLIEDQKRAGRENSSFLWNAIVMVNIIFRYS